MYTKTKELYNTYNTLLIIQLHEMQILDIAGNIYQLFYTK